MITNGFTYIAVLIFIAAMLVWLQRYTKSKFFDYAPPSPLSPFSNAWKRVMGGNHAVSIG